MNKRFAIAIALGGWMLIGTTIFDRGVRGQQNPTLEDVDTVNDVPRATTREVDSIVPQIPNPFATPPETSRTNFRARFLTETTPYILYNDSVFETLIGEDDVRLRLEFEPYRDGGNLKLGLPVE
ncbi:hypothetical protein IQ235_07210 [Oscillatoriales cyanobacterium LEGE 11467]|uniref:Uncharacterized protein n=1 Tax=Zarconia navalis LEGE 11467 TaxID=1828826 RepID=A0A928VYP0_9CYAN|nr:hypothetical protein [Zarconia navalis]MBE9040573.1 hypothetical protein [Zarconia navalis LEGE 11467]